MTPSEAMHLIVIGSSAGGIEALGTVLAALPTGFPAPIVIAQHIDPDRPSHLADILGRRSNLPVHTITGQEELRPGVVFVVPANSHVEITDHAVTLRPDGGGGPKPSVNLLFRSAAAAFGESLVAVILSGTGSDGATGAHAVKQQGGMVIIQNPETATYPGMPASLAPATVDIVADIERIGPLLNDLMTGQYVPAPPESDQELQELLEMLRERSGIDFSTYKGSTIRRRLQRRMAATESRTIADYSAYLSTHPEEYHRLVSAFLIKVTEFYRDPELFRYLGEQVLPAIVEEAQKTDREIRIWSAGCSTGEEAYSLAILLSETLGSDLDRHRARIFATDLDEDAISFARRGIYPASALADLDRDLVSRYFIDEGGEYAVRKGLRGLVIFGQHDLGLRPPFPHTDLVVCRNVLIYFTTELQKRALQLFAFSLRDGGYLVLGKAESISPLPDYFGTDSLQLKVFRRHGPQLLIPPMPGRAVPVISPRERPLHRALGMSEETRAEAAAAEAARRALLEQFDAVFLNLPVGLVIVNRAYDVLRINSEARRLLGIYGVAVDDDFVHLADRLPSRQLRAVIDRAFRAREVTELNEVEIVNPGPPPSHRYLDLVCGPHPIAEGEPELLSVLVHDVTTRVSDRQERDIALAEQQHRRESELEELRRTYETELEDLRRKYKTELGEQRQILETTVRKQDEEKTTLSTEMTLLVEANSELRFANEQLTSANVQLRVANDEALIGTEEAQAASEEVETLNEELQSSNEELETLNEELQATVEELNTTNEELTSRSAQLQQMAASRDEERRAAEQAKHHLEAAFVALPEAILLVDTQAKTILTNKRYAETFGSSIADFQAEDADGRPLRHEDSPQARAARGETFELEFGVRVAGQQPRWLQASGRPLNSEDGTGVAGGLILLREVGRNAP